MDGRVAEHRVTAGCEQRQREDTQPADEAAQVLTRTRSFKSKQLVRSQAIRESQSPPRVPSPLVPASPEQPPSQHCAETAQPNITFNNSKSDIVVSSSGYSNVSLNSCVSSFNSDVRSDASRVVCARMATNSSQNDTQKISGRNLRMEDGEGKCQSGAQRPVEIQITSGSWDSMVYEEDDASILQESGLDESGGGSTPSASRMECVCGHCEGTSVKIGAISGVCPDCQCRIRTRAQCCRVKQDSGVGCCSDECPDCALEQSEPEASTGSELLSSIHRSTRVSPCAGDGKQDSSCIEDDAQGSDDGQYDQGPLCRCQVKNGHQMQRNDSEEAKLEPQGAELVRFIRCTLNKNRRDRIVLLKIERELAMLVNDTSRCTAKFPTMSSYHRMLVHRCAALFGLKHLLDPTSRLAVIVTKTGTSGGRIPCTGFRQWCSVQFPVSPGRYQQDMPQAKSILKRDTHSLDEALSGQAGANAASARSKSFEQREEEYERVRRRIFSGDEAGNGEDMGWPWLQEGGRPQPPVKLLTPECGAGSRQNKLLKVQSLETREPPSAQTMRAAVSKSHSFGGYGGVGGDRGSPPGLAGPPSRILSRQGDLASSSWRLSPSSSGYKTLSLRSTDSITPSPTGDHTPEPVYDAAQPTAPVLWAVTDMAAIPPGALIIHPQTGQPLTNADGSLYHYDPARPPRLPPHSPGVPPGATHNGLVNTAQDKKNEWVGEKRRGRLEKQNSVNASDYDCANAQEYQKNCCQPQNESENYQQYCANCPQPGDQDMQYSNMQKPSVIVTDSVANIQNVDSKPNMIMSKAEIESNNNNYQMADSAIDYSASSGFDGKPDEAMYSNVGAQFCQQEYEGGPLGYKGSEVMFQERKEGEGMVQYSVYYHQSNGGFQQPNAPDYVDGQNQLYRANEEQVVQNAPGVFCVPENETNLPLTALQVKASQYQPAGLVPHNPHMYPPDVDVMRQHVALASGAMLYTGAPPATNYAQQHCRIDSALPQLYNPGVPAQSCSEQQQQPGLPAPPKPSLSPEAGGCGQHYGPCLVDPNTGLLHCQRAYPLVFPPDQLGALPRAFQHSAGIVSAASASAQPLPAHLHAFTYPTAAHWSPSWPTVLQPPPCGTPGPKPMTPPTVYMPQPELGITQQTYHTLPSLYQYQPGYAYQAYPTAVIPQVFAQPYPICQPLYHSNAITPDGRQSTGVPNNLNSYTDVTSTLMQQHQTNSYYNQNRRNSHSGVKSYDSYKSHSKFNDNSAMKNNKSFGTSGSVSGSARTTPLGGQYTPPVTLTDVTFSQNEQIETERNRNNAYTFNKKTYYHNNMAQNNNVTSSYISPYGITDHQQSNVNNDGKYISNVKKNEGLISPRHYHKSIAAARNANHQNLNEKNVTANFDSCCQYRPNASNAFVVTNDVNARRKAFRNNSSRSQNSVNRQDLHSQRVAMENMIKSFTETRLNQNSADQKVSPLSDPNDVHQRFAVLQKSYSVDGTAPPVANSNVKDCQRLQNSGGGGESIDSGNIAKAHNQAEAQVANHLQTDYRSNSTATRSFCNKYNARPSSSDSSNRLVAPPCAPLNQVYVENYSGGKVNGHVGAPLNGNRPSPKEEQNHESNKKLEVPHQGISSSGIPPTGPPKSTAVAASGNAAPGTGTSSVPTQTSGGANASGIEMQSERDDRLAQPDTPTNKSNTSTPPREPSTQVATYSNNTNSNYSNNSCSNKQHNQEYHPPANYRGANSFSSYAPYRPNGVHSYGRPGGRGHQQNVPAALHSAPAHAPPAQPVMQHLQNLSLQYGRQFLFARQMSAGWSRRSPAPVPTGFTSHLRYNGPRGPRYNSHGQHRR